MKKSMNNKKNRRNILKSNIILLLVIFSCFGIFTTFINAKEEIITSDYFIQENDTLWNIAGEICKSNSDKDLNRQNIIIKIKNINNLEESNIYAGQVIKLPVY